MSTRTTLAARLTKKARIRKKVRGTTERPRLSVYRSNEHIYGQIVNDESGSDGLQSITLVSASSLQMKLDGKGMEIAAKVGDHLAKAALEKGITLVVFDRGGFKYHGRIRALAESARKAGLQF